MQPLTETVPKPLLPIDGKPVLESIIELLMACGIRDTVIVVGRLKEKIQKFLDEKANLGARIVYAYQDEARGSGDAVNKARDLIDEDFLVIASDTVFNPVEIREMVTAFKSSALNALIGLKRVPPEELKRRSTVKVDKNDFIKQIIEKPRENEALSNISAAPLFIFTPRIWPYLEKLEPSKNGKYELAAAIQQLINKEDKVRGYHISYSRDITRPIDVLKENFSYLRDL